MGVQYVHPARYGHGTICPPSTIWPRHNMSTQHDRATAQYVRNVFLKNCTICPHCLPHNVCRHIMPFLRKKNRRHIVLCDISCCFGEKTHRRIVQCGHMPFLRKNLIEILCCADKSCPHKTWFTSSSYHQVCRDSLLNTYLVRASFQGWRLTVKIVQCFTYIRDASLPWNCGNPRFLHQNINF